MFENFIVSHPFITFISFVVTSSVICGTLLTLFLMYAGKVTQKRSQQKLCQENLAKIAGAEKEETDMAVATIKKILNDQNN